MAFIFPFTRKRFGSLISRRLMPAQNGGWEPPNIALLRENRGIGNVQITNVKINLANGAQIDLCQYYAGNENAYDTVIIHAPAEQTGYENHIAEYIQKAKDFPNTCIVAFNFRHVGASTGDYAHSEEDWIQDTLAVINHYRRNDIQAENILLTGQSLGGAIVTLAAAKYYEQQGRQHCLKVMNDRTFSDLLGLLMCKHEKHRPAYWGLISGVLFGLAELAASPFITFVFTASLLWLSLICAVTLLPRFFGIDVANSRFFNTCAAFGTCFGAMGLAWCLLPMLALSPMLSASIVAASLSLSGIIPLLRPLGEGIREITMMMTLGPILWLSFGIMNVKVAYAQLPNNAKEYVTAKNDHVIPRKASLHFAAHSALEKERAPNEETRRDIKDRKLSYPQNTGRSTHSLSLAHLYTHHKLRGNPDQPPQIDGETVMQNKTHRLLNLPRP